MSIYCIAEIGINHNGDLDITKKLIDVAADAGADAVKFQKRDIDSVYTQEFLEGPRESQWGTTQREQKMGLEFGEDEYAAIDVYCKEKNIDWLESLFLLKSPTLNLLQAAPQIFSLREITINGTGSLNNPKQTGIFYGFQQILSLFSLERIDIEFTPSFHPKALNGKIQSKLHFQHS